MKMKNVMNGIFNLIWDKIKDQFFYKVLNNKYEFYRNPNAVRYISVDQSYAKDDTGISMSHVELKKDGTLVFITDFAITIHPTKEKINLEAMFNRLELNQLRAFIALLKDSEHFFDEIW